MKKVLCATMAFSLCGLSEASHVYTCKVGNRSLTFVEAKGSHVEDPTTRTLTYVEGRREHRDEDPTVEQTVFGKVVSSMYHINPDHSSTYISIIIPRMNLAHSGALEFDTLLSKTEHKTAFGGQHLVNGLLDVATHETVTCSASVAH